jgi:hypothetical protein
MLASLLYPYDDDAPTLIEGWLEDLERENCIRRYEVDGSHYLEIINWQKHQRIEKPSASRLPKFEEGSPTIPGKVGEDSRTDMDLGPRTSIKKDSCTKPEKVSHDTVSKTQSEKHKRNAYPADFEEFWNAYPIDRGMAKQEAAKVWAKLSPEDRRSALNGIPGFKVWIRKQGSDYRTLHACRYLSQRRFDGFTATNGNGHGVLEDEPVWAKRLSGARSIKKWCFHDWGPPPNSPGCRVPEHLVTDTDGHGWSDVEVRPEAA